MKKLLLTLGMVLATQILTAQTNLEQKYKVELGIQGLSVGTEIPLNNKFLADVNLGWGGTIDLGSGIRYEWSGTSNSAFARGQVRYYLNRERRERKGHSLKNNSGTFIAYQTKFHFSGLKSENYLFDPQVGKVWLNEFQFGQQLPLGNHFIFRYHTGFGYGYDLDYKHNTLYPSLGFAFGYVF